MFTPNFRERLKLGKYTSWACDLGEDQLAAVLWLVGEYGCRASMFKELLDRSVSEGGHFPMEEVGYARVRWALGLLDEMANGRRYTVEEVKMSVKDSLRRFRPDETGLSRQEDA